MPDPKKSKPNQPTIGELPQADDPKVLVFSGPY